MVTSEVDDLAEGGSDRRVPVGHLLLGSGFQVGHGCRHEAWRWLLCCASPRTGQELQSIDSARHKAQVASNRLIESFLLRCTCVANSLACVCKQVAGLQKTRELERSGVSPSLPVCGANTRSCVQHSSEQRPFHWQHQQERAMAVSCNNLR